jgi:hypothetical protein
MSLDLVTRAEWGAAPPRSSRPMTAVRHLILHHSAGTDRGTETVRAVQRFHQGERGWADIAYSWLYSPSADRFYVGRGGLVAGGHTKGRNLDGHALCVLGNYETEVPTPRTMERLEAFRLWHDDTYGMGTWSLHRDYAPTACPGRHLAAALAQPAPTPTPTPVPPPPPRPARPVLKRGARGPDVADLQRRLSISADGIFGPVTQRAVRRFQRSAGLVADGIVGPLTWTALGG